MAAAGLDPDRAGGERHPVRVAAFPGEPGEPGPLPGPVPRAGPLPVPVGVHRALDAVRERLLADLRPPCLAGLGIGALGALGPVPPHPHRGQRSLTRLARSGHHFDHVFPGHGDWTKGPVNDMGDRLARLA
jgi:hypothetical protein